MEAVRELNSIKRLLDQFHGSLEGLRELLQFVGPKLVERQVERQSFESLLSRSGLAGDAIQEAMAIWEVEVERRAAQLEAEMRDEGDSDTETDDDAQADMRRALVRFQAEQESMLADGVTELLSKEGVLSAFVHHLNRQYTKLPDIETVHRSAITMAVGSFEVLVGGIVASYLRTHPKALGGDEAEFSVGDLLRLDSVEAALDEAIERRVERFLYQGFDKWAEIFLSRLNMDWSELAIDWDATREVIQRRHIIVHNGSRVSRQYLERVPDNFKEVPLGRELFHPPNYVARALSLLTGLGDCVAAQAWARLSKEDSSAAANALLHKSFDLLVAGSYLTAQHVANIGRAFDADAEITMSLQCNAWIAHKQMEGIDAIREAVGLWDTSAASLKFRVAKSALLDEFDHLATALPACLDAGELSIEDVKFWPLFKELREEALFVDLLERYGTESGRNSSA